MRKLKFYKKLLLINEELTAQALLIKNFERILQLMLHRQLVKDEIIAELEHELSIYRKAG